MWKLGGLTGKELLGRTWSQFWKDRVPNQSAMLSFYFLLSIFPLLLFLIALLGVFLQSGPALQNKLHQYLATVAPSSASSLIDTTLGEISQGSGPVKLSVALLFTWWSASQGMFAIVEGLNIAYGVREARPWWKKYLVASALTIASLVLFAGALLLLIYGGVLSAAVAKHFGHGAVIAGIWQTLTWLLLLAFVLIAFNILYVYAPNVKHQQWHWLMPGTLVGVSTWLLGSYGFKVYLNFFNSYTVTYGSLGAVIILMLWFYLSGIAILLGGEVNSEIEKSAGQTEQHRPEQAE
ncbi:MAG: YihY/virulence factor BrkB family protein [Pseudomonadota bacterium]|nr:YihY/virulence factor BrkB family protein [Pseudomonadota bacterium]